MPRVGVSPGTWEVGAQDALRAGGGRGDAAGSGGREACGRGEVGETRPGAEGGRPAGEGVGRRLAARGEGTSEKPRCEEVGPR